MEDFVLEFQEHDKLVNNTSTESSTDIQVLQIFMAVNCVVGFLTNGPLLYILTKTNLTVALNALILSLTFSNLLFVLFYMPFATFGSPCPFEKTACMAIGTVSSVCFTVWPATLIALIARRWFDKPETPALSGGRMPKSTVYAVIAIWTFVVVLALSTILFAGIFASEKMFSDKYLVVETVISSVTVLAVPLVAVAFYLYDVATRNEEQSREENEISTLVLVLVSVYTVCHVPSAIFQFVFELFVKEFNSFWNDFDNTRLYLYFAYPSVCTVALFCASGSFRQLFKQHVTGTCCCKAGNQEPVVYRELGMQPLVSQTETLASPENQGKLDC